MYNKKEEYKTKYPQITVDNFRDLGGIELADGRVILDGKIFRSGELFGLDDAEKQALDSLNINYIFDLRGYDEVEYKPDYVPHGAVYVNIPAAVSKRSMVVKPDLLVKMIPTFLPAKFSIWAFRSHFKKLYSKFPFANDAYAEIFKAMDGGGNVLFHCTAGKDRTGVASMLILLALGADKQTLIDDYMLSNFYREENMIAFNKQFEKEKHYGKLVKIFSYSNKVHLELFNQAYDAIFAKYKTAEEFFLNEYGVDGERINKWKELYTKI